MSSHMSASVHRSSRLPWTAMRWIVDKAVKTWNQTYEINGSFLVPVILGSRHLTKRWFKVQKTQSRVSLFGSVYPKYYLPRPRGYHLISFSFSFRKEYSIPFCPVFIRNMTDLLAILMPCYLPPATGCTALEPRPNRGCGFAALTHTACTLSGPFFSCGNNRGSPLDPSRP